MRETYDASQSSVWTALEFLATWWLQASILLVVGVCAAWLCRKPVYQSTISRVSLVVILVCPLLSGVVNSLGFSIWMVDLKSWMTATVEPSTSMPALREALAHVESTGATKTFPPPSLSTVQGSPFESFQYDTARGDELGGNQYGLPGREPQDAAPFGPATDQYQVEPAVSLWSWPWMGLLAIGTWCISALVHLCLVVRDLYHARQMLRSRPSAPSELGANVYRQSACTRWQAGLADFVTRSVAGAYASAKQLRELSGHDSSSRYPESQLGQNLKLVSQLMKTDNLARVYYTSQSGYDTHANQLPRHESLLAELANALTAFMNDLRASGLDDRVMVLCFSEFGRRVHENDSLGTDHGAAGPVFLAGTKLKSRIFGKHPALDDLDQGDLKYQHDFRAIYGALLREWLELPVPKVLETYASELASVMFRLND